MHANFAQLGLVLSILLSILAPFGFIWLKSISPAKFSKLLNNIILFQFISVSFAFFSLTYAYISSDFSLLNVFNNSHLAIPLIFKFSGVWSNHEGSMILWLFILGLANIFTTQHKLNSKDRIWISTSLIIITGSLISYTVLKSNPFIKLLPAPLQGQGFNPLLQDIGLAIHPPLLYIGYITTIVAFVIAITGLIRKKLSPELLDLMQKWSLFSWSFLTLGVMLGSWWAYRELGWGGYWFWDPVENASLLPWLTSTALIHSIYASKKLDTNYRWTMLLAILTFLLSILSTFLVRSGVITSVHSFANDPERGSFILGLLITYTATSLGLFAIRAHRLNSTIGHNWLSRFGGINISNILWIVATFTILLSLLYPLLLGITTGEQITVSGVFFEKSFIPLLLFILVIMAFALPTSWKAILPLHYRQFIYSILLSSILSGVFYYYSTPSLVSGSAFFAGILVMIRMSFWYKQRLLSPTKPTIKFYAIWFVHLAAGLFAITLAILEANEKEALITMREGDKIEFAGFNLNYAKKESSAVENYLVGKIILYLEKDNKELAILTPEIRYYPVENKQTSESSVYHHYLYDFYVVISENTKGGLLSVRLYLKPLISWIWGICMLIFACGILLFTLHCRKKTNAHN